MLGEILREPVFPEEDFEQMEKEMEEIRARYEGKLNEFQHNMINSWVPELHGEHLQQVPSRHYPQPSPPYFMSIVIIHRTLGNHQFYSCSWLFRSR